MIDDHLTQELEELLVEELQDVESEQGAELVVFNDDFNTFDWVIESFIDICNHSFEQAEQLSLLVHFKGRATVKSGPMRLVKPMKDGLIDRGISAVIER